MKKPQKWFKVVETALLAVSIRMIGARQILKTCLTKESADAYAANRRKEGKECGVVTWEE